MFAISKILGFLSLPSNFLSLIGIVGIILLIARKKRVALAMLIVSCAGLVLAGLSPLPNLMLLTLSERFPPWNPAGRDPDGIIILGGVIEPNKSAMRGAIELNGAGERILAMLQLARRYPNARIIFSGGSDSVVREPIPEAPFAGKLLDEFGLSHDRVVLETSSRTTAENAEQTRKLVSPKPGERWLLVTSAFHMPRSVGAFRKVGFDVEAYPLDWRTVGPSDMTTPFDRLSRGLAIADIAMHEWTGLITYRLAGKTSELVPAPR